MSVPLTESFIRQARIEIMWQRAGVHAALCARNGGDYPIWGVYIFCARYGGLYEGGKWIAWIGDHEWLEDHRSGDNACMSFWEDYRMAPIGRGDTPNDALTSLHRICVTGRALFVAPTPIGE